jgi:3D (Asp-Asp-Asp) domain-containing protein
MRSGIIRNLFKKYPGVWKVALTALIISAVIYLSLEIARANESIQMLDTSNERLVDKNEKLGIESKKLFELSQELSLRGDELTIKLENQEKEFVKLVDSNVSLQQAIEKRDAEIKRMETSYQKEVSTLKNRAVELEKKATELQRKINQQKVSQQRAKQSTTQTATQPKVAAVSQRVVSRATSSSSSKTITVSATAYTAFCNGCSGITATGINLRANPGLKVIAVDPRVIPLGSKVHVEGYGYAIAGDTGGAIKGNKIDLFMPSRSNALNFGRKTVSVKILNKK